MLATGIQHTKLQLLRKKINIKKKPRSGHHEVAVLVSYLEEKEFGALFFFWRKVENPGTTPSSEMNLYLSGSDCAHHYPIPANLKYLTCDPCELLGNKLSSVS